jgi:hypothetical protein
MDACRHLKAIGLSGAPELAAKARVGGEAGVTDFGSTKDIQKFLDVARSGKVWEREPA